MLREGLADDGAPATVRPAFGFQRVKGDRRLQYGYRIVLAVERVPDNCPALVLNADYRPLSYFPLSLWSWQDTIKAVFLDRVNIVAEYERTVRSTSFQMRLPSVVSLKTYVRPTRNPAFTR